MTYECIRVTYYYIRVHTSDIQKIHEYRRVTYEWRAHMIHIRMTYECIQVTYEWHMNDIWVQTSNIRVSYEYIRVIYHYIRVDTSDIQMIYEYITYEWYANDEWHTNTCKYIRMTCEYKQVTYVQYNDALVSVQYNAALAIIGTIQSISKESCIKT